jgi:hypothetical protein
MRSRSLGVFGGALALTTAAVMFACVGSDPGPGSASTPTNDSGDGPREDGSGITPSGDSGPGTDSSVSDAGDGGPPPFDVRVLPGLRLWLESTHDLIKANAGTDVVSWGDGSQRWDGGTNVGAPDGGRHVAFPVAYTLGGPLYPSIVTNGINGRPAVAFTDGPKLAVANHPDFELDTGDFVIVAVGSVSTGTGPFWRLMTATTGASGTNLLANSACTFMGARGASPDCTSPEYAPNTSAHTFVMRRKAAQLIFRVDATSRGTYDFGADNPNLTVFDFQQPNAFIGGAFAGQLAELIVVVGPTSDADLDRLETHLKAKYALP